jgi:ABC-type antimicrobial peptide transport system permease subunit
MSGTVRRVAADVSPEIPVAFTTMEETVSKNVEDSRFRALLFNVFAGLAACLAIAGVYGVMTFAVGQRSKEIALRIALGAGRSTVLRLILGQGLLLTATGLALGLAAAAAITRLLTTVLFAVQPLDAQVYVTVSLMLGALTVLASYLPARRATVVDPIEILKTD